MQKIPPKLDAAIGRVSSRDDLARFAVDGAEPLAVVSPSSEDALSEVVAAADGDGVAVFPRGGGTRTALGGVPSRAGIVADLSRLNRVVAHNAGDMTAAFQAGASMALVAEALAQQGQMLAIDAPLPARATVGGTLATALNGPFKWHFGHARDTVIGMRVVQPDGETTKSGGRVVKNVSGYDMARLHIGGLGTLGIIVEAAFKLTPIPMYEDTLLASFGGDDGDSRRAATAAAMGVFNSHAMPLAMTAMDAGAARHAGADAERGEALLAIRFGGRHRTLERQLDDAARICQDAGARRVERLGGGASRLWRALSDFGWEDGDSAPALAVRVSALPDRTGAAAAAIADAGGERFGLAPRAAWHPGFGAADGAWSAADESDPPSADDLAAAVKRLRESAAKIGARAIVTRCPTAVKRKLDIWGGEPQGFATMRRLKAVYDPNNTMNPGRYVGGI